MREQAAEQRRLLQSSVIVHLGDCCDKGYKTADLRKKTDTKLKTSKVVVGVCVTVCEFGLGIE